MGTRSSPAFRLGAGPQGNRRGLLVLNHEYVDQAIIFPDGPTPMTTEKVAKALAGHGVTVIEVRLVGGKWQQAGSP